MCYIAAYIYIYKYMRSLINTMTNFNERTNTLLYKNISLTLYSRKGNCFLTSTDCYFDASSSSPIAALLPHLCWVPQLWVLRAQSPLSATGSQLGILSPTDCFSKCANSKPIASGHDVIHTPVNFLSGVYYDNSNCHILCARA